MIRQNVDISKLKYIRYIRRSQDREDRQVASIDAQFSVLDKLQGELGLNIVETIIDEQSAKYPGRSGFATMLEKIQQGEADAILCWKINRLARNPVDGGQIIWLLQQGVLRHVQTFFGHGHFPTDNMLMLHVEFGMSNQYSIELGQDVKRNLQRKAERGWYPVSVPQGYLHNPPERRRRPDIEDEIICDPERFDLVRKMFDLMLTGSYAPPKILEIASNEWGYRTRTGKTLSRSNLYHLFDLPFYYGEFEYPRGSGNWYAGKHKPLISKKEFDRVQELLHGRVSPRPKTLDFPFRGPIFCGECGAMITAHNRKKTQKSGTVHHYTYYHCTKRKKDKPCSQPHIEARQLEEQIVRTLQGVEISGNFRRWALRKLKEKDAEEGHLRDDMLETHTKELVKIDKRINVLTDMRNDEEIDREEFARRKKALFDERQRILGVLDHSNGRVEEWFRNMEYCLDFAETALARFKTGDTQTKRDILSMLGSNLLLKDKTLCISMPDELLDLVTVAPHVRVIEARFEPLKGVETLNDLDRAYQRDPNLSAWLERVWNRQMKECYR